jgi:DNA-directed RNA polymerase specialized sigma24 family protein
MHPDEDELAAWREKLLGSSQHRDLPREVREDLTQSAVERFLATPRYLYLREDQREKVLWGIFRRRGLDWKRSKARENRRREVLEDYHVEGSVLRDVELALVLIQELERLGEGRALLFALHDQYDWSSKRCAALFGITASSVDSKLSRTRDVLQERLARFDPR